MKPPQRTEAERIAGTLTVTMRRTLLWMPAWPYARDWGEITSAFGPRGSFRTLVEPLVTRGLLVKSDPQAGHWHYRLTDLGTEVVSLLSQEQTDE